MRKKRLAFGKFSIIASIGALLLLDTPSSSCIFPLLMGSGWNALKMGTQMGHNLTPDRFFLTRTFLSFYNIAFLMAIWWRLSQARSDKRELEFAFFQRTESVMLTMTNIFQDSSVVERS